MTEIQLLHEESRQAAIKAHASGKYKDAYQAYRDIFKSVPSSEGDTDRWWWGAFVEAFTIEEGNRRKSLYKVDEFMEKLDTLCQEYGVSLSSGCGCCGAGGYFGKGDDTYEFSFNIQH
jgi:hypothetical protein